MRIEEFIKDLLFDFDTVVIPGFGAFVATEQSAYIEDGTRKIYPPSKEIAFSDQLQLDDGLLIGKIKDELQINQNSAIQLVQNYVEQLSKDLEQNQTYTIKRLGNFSRDEDNVLVFQQDETVNYLVEAYGLEPVDLPKRVTINETLDGVVEKENEVEELLNEGDTLAETNQIAEEADQLEEQTSATDVTSNLNPHDNQEVISPEENTVSYESLEEDDIDMGEAEFQDFQTQQEEVVLTNEYSIDEEKIASGFDEYVEDNNEKYQIEAQNIETFTDETTPKKGFSWWLLLLPLLLLVGAGFLLFSIMGKSENPYAKEMQEISTPPKTEAEKTEPKPIVTESKKSETKKSKEDLSTNSTASLLKPKDEKKKETVKPKKETVKPKSIKSTTDKNLKRGYYVIISSIPNKQEANNEAKKWTAKNYEAAVLPGPNNYNRVGIYVGTDKTTSETKLAEYKNSINSAAWVLKY